MAESWPALDARERRVLGVLVEKAKTTPDAYPLSVNALTTGCNQKSNRDPLMDLTEVEVEETLARLQKKGLVLRITGGRVERWRHTLYDTWHVGKDDLAVLAELLLRGPQTEGELRSRAARMEPFDDLDALRKVLGPLSSRKLIVYFDQAGRRGIVLSHGFHPSAELEQLKKRQAADEPPPTPAAAAPPDPGLADAQAEIAKLRQELDALRTTVAELGKRLDEVRQGLGM
jgi:uncharacterized protein